MHSSAVDTLGSGGSVLAQTRSTPVEAAEIRGGGRLSLFTFADAHAVTDPTEPSENIVSAPTRPTRSSTLPDGSGISRLGGN